MGTGKVILHGGETRPYCTPESTSALSSKLSTDEAIIKHIKAYPNGGAPMVVTALNPLKQFRGGVTSCDLRRRLVTVQNMETGEKMQASFDAVVIPL